MTLERKLLLTIAILLGTGLLVFQYILYDYTKTRAEADLLSSARHVRNVLMATRRVYHHQFLESGLPLNDKTLGFLPAHALSQISKDFSNWDKSGFSFNNVSDRPRNPTNKADAIEMEAMNHFRAHPKDQERFVSYRAADGELYFHYSQPIWIEPYCLACHGSKSSAPPTIQARYDSAYDYKVGDLRGIVSIKIPGQYLQARVEHVFFIQFWWSLALVLLLGLAIAYAIRRHVILPIALLTKGVDRVKAGEHDHPVPELPGEFNAIGNSFNAMVAAVENKQVALSQSEERFRMLMKAAADAILLTDREGIVRFWNDAATTLFGYSADEMVGQSFERLMPEPCRAAHRQGTQKAYLGEVSKYLGHAMETHALNREGALIPIEMSLNLWRNQDERYHVAIIRDISARKQAEDALRASEAKFHNIVDSSSDWVYWINPDGTFRYMTPSVEQITGYQAEDFERSKELIDAIVHPDDRPTWLQHTHLHLSCDKDRTVSQLEMRVIRKNGETIWVSHVCRPLFGSGGEYLGRRVAVRDTSERKLADEQIRNLAYFDPLTGLPNRRLFIDRLGQAIVASVRSKMYGALLMLDLDHFKNLNDTRGHDEGDRLLVEVSKRLLATVRQGDTVSRQGGDEFLVVLEGLGEEENTAANHVEQIAEKIRQELTHAYSLRNEGNGYFCTTSIGVTLFHGQEASIDLLVKQADLALYQAKDAGRNTIRFFNTAMQDAITARSTLEEALRQGMRNGEFRLYYQPQVDQSGHLIGAEALMRWLHPQRGTVSPLEFIPLAEETGLIIDLGKWALETACSQLKRWEADPRTRDLKIAVNVSARQFRQADFLGQVKQILCDSGARPDKLKLEVTESVVLDDFASADDLMKQLNALGVSFSLDDFGTGYSSLSYLKRLPIDQVKIDKSFVRDVTSDPGDAAIVRAVLAMCQSLDLTVIAEGVETEAQLEFLSQSGCRSFQGYLFGRPAPIEDWDEVLGRFHSDET